MLPLILIQYYIFATQIAQRGIIEEVLEIVPLVMLFAKFVLMDPLNVINATTTLFLIFQLQRAYQLAHSTSWRITNRIGATVPKSAISVLQLPIHQHVLNAINIAKFVLT
jgi:hypothetical protein